MPATETIPLFAPSTAARSQLSRLDNRHLACRALPAPLDAPKFRVSEPSPPVRLPAIATAVPSDPCLPDYVFIEKFLMVASRRDIKPDGGRKSDRDDIVGIIRNKQLARRGLQDSVTNTSQRP
jgi:hypothetical protein